MTNENLNLPMQPTPSELYDQLCNLQQLITYLTDKQLEETLEWCAVAIDYDTSVDDEEILQLQSVCWLEQQEREAHDKWLTKDQLADMLGNDNAHYAWDGDDLYYLAHPDQNDDNY